MQGEHSSNPVDQTGGEGAGSSLEEHGATGSNGVSNRTDEEPTSRQTLEEFALAASNLSSDQEEAYASPPTSIHISINDDQSCTSSVTTTHFRNAELFVPSIYPSTRGIAEDDVNNMTQMHEILPAAVEEEGISTQENNEGHREKRTVKVDHNILHREKGRLRGNNLSQSKHGENIEHCANNSADMAITMECHIELSVRKCPDEVGDHIAHIPTTTMKNSALRSTAQPTQTATTAGTTGLFARIMGMETNATNNPNLETQREHTVPGAYAVVTTGGWHAAMGDGSQGHQSQEDTSSSQDSALDLAEAQPVSDFPVAVLQESMAWDTSERGLTRGWVLLFLLLVLGVGLATTLLGTHPWGHSPVNDKYKHTKAKILETFGEDYFDNPQKEEALQWIVHEDPLQDMAVKDSRATNLDPLIQRYALAAFYFQTTSKQPWRYCNPPVGKQADTCFFFANQYSKKEQESVRWLSAAHECHWMGIDCKGSSVTSLRINNNNLTGHVPSELSKLGSIKLLNLESNHLLGPLPLWIDQLTSLEKLDLNSNSFTGRIPPTLFLGHKLMQVSLHSNQISGAIPTAIGSFAGKTLMLGHNILTGSIPTAFYLLTKLDMLGLGNNDLTGTLSTFIGWLSGLQCLYLESTRLKGTIPTEIALVSNLSDFSFSMTNMEGSIPEELYFLHKLTSLDMSGSKISGTISSRVGDLVGLEWMDLANTQISGIIPEEISKLTNLHQCQLSGNKHLMGRIPQKLCSSQVNHRDAIIADCMPSESTGVPAVSCPKGCCSKCCDAETKICLEQ